MIRKSKKISIAFIAAAIAVVTLFPGAAAVNSASLLWAEDSRAESMKEKDSTGAKVDVSDRKNTASNDQEENEIEGANLFETVKQGGPLMIFLLFLVIASLTIIVERLIYFTKNNIWKSDSLNLYMRENSELSDAKFMEDLEDELRSAFHIYSNGMEKGLALLSGIGNIAPVVGFLGTVIGMISAFASIAAATTVNAKVVAVGIQIALVTTAGGLLVAAPTLAFYYLFTHIIQNRYANSEEIISELSGPLPRLSTDRQSFD